MQESGEDRRDDGAGPARSGAARVRHGVEDWTAVRTADGSFTLAHPDHGETCHSRSGAWQQARERYARACRLHERVGEVRLLDIGTGLGLNLAAALEALRAGSRLRAFSLEIDRAVIEAGLALVQPPEIASRLAPVRTALTEALRGRGQVPLGNGTLQLLLGDARDTLPALEVDAVFLDPFSPRVDPPLWGPGFLREVAGRMAPGSRLSTYTTSMSVRAALHAAGLRVGPGPRVGTKASGTLASPDQDVGEFDPRTRRRLLRRAAEVGFSARGEIPARHLT